MTRQNYKPILEQVQSILKSKIRALEEGPYITKDDWMRWLEHTILYIGEEIGELEAIEEDPSILKRDDVVIVNWGGKKILALFEGYIEGQPDNLVIQLGGMNGVWTADMEKFITQIVVHKSYVTPAPSMRYDRETGDIVDTALP
jgi:hypothetical protein